MIRTVYVDKTESRDEQEFIIDFMSDELQSGSMNIFTNIPKLARKYRKFLVSGKEIVNSVSGQIIGIHGAIENCNVTISKKRVLSDEEKAEISERFEKARQLKAQN